jgi:hypothetical protein
VGQKLGDAKVGILGEEKERDRSKSLMFLKWMFIHSTIIILDIKLFFS